MPQKLPDIEGITPTRALLYRPGEDTRFRNSLRQFAHSYVMGFTAVVTALRHDDTATARALLHAFRGACYAIGAIELQEKAQALHEALGAAVDRTISLTVPPLRMAEVIHRDLLRLVIAIAEI